MLVSDIVKFNREKYYNGAVQTEWFYDADKVGKIAQSYVFHGPKYYGVSAKDVNSVEHKLLDTASFCQIISNKLCGKDKKNSFVLTIAGYGTGKSHLAVTLGALFSGNRSIRGSILDNIANADKAIATDIQSNIDKKNLVIALNGMTNFNLDAEVLRCVRLSLQQNNVSDEVLKQLTKTYEIAKYFIGSNFESCKERFEQSAVEKGIIKKGEDLKQYLLSSLETDKSTIAVVNQVFSQITGDSLHWDKGISAGDVILTVSRELCGEDKPFNKVLILFDEFGRYIEYVAANPTIAGDASLQQVFESIQSSDGKAVFVGFIQYELEAYLSHIDKTANVIRYVGRYSSSEKYYLSSNFETILANLLEKKSDGSFERKVTTALKRYENFHSRMHSALGRWNGNKGQKSVWQQGELYRKVILEGCYPLHPITVWHLSNSSEWMQQRSTIAFCTDMFESVASEKIEDDWLPYVYPVDIVDSGIYAEMLSSEEKGLVKSQNCMLYNEICIKVGDKLTRQEKLILKAILISKIGGFKFYDKEDAYVAYRYLTNLKEDEIKPAVRNLEDRHGVIAYDDQACTYDLIAEANGFNEFRRVYARYRTGKGKGVSVEDIDEETLKSLGLLDAVDTAFGQEKHISSSEWKFEKRLLDSASIDANYLDSAIRTVNVATDGELYRGILIFAYCYENAESEISRLCAAASSTKLDSTPVIILFLDDSEAEIAKALSIKSTMSRFSVSDAERFSKHIISQRKKQDKLILQKFNALVTDRKMISERGLITYDMRLNALCTKRFTDVYLNPVMFVFDGFESSKSAQAKKTFATICIKLFDNTLMNIQSYQALNTADKNRIQSCITVGGKYSWQIFTDECKLVLPQYDVLKNIYAEADAAIPDEGAFSVSRLFSKYLHAPYGMNAYSYTLFVLYFIQKHENKLVCFLGNEKLTASNLSNVIFKDSKLKFSELQRVTIQRNLNADVDVVKDICNEILENIDANKCSQLRKRMNDILRIEGDTIKHQTLIGQAKMRLDEGDSICSKLEDRKAKIKQLLDDANAKFVIHRFVGVFDYYFEPKGIIEEGLPYVYSDDYVEHMRNVKKRIDILLSDTFYATLKILRCSDITHLGSFQNTYKKVIRVLTDHGFYDQATAAEKRVEEIVAETKALNQYNQVISEFEKDCALNDNCNRVPYSECEDLVDKFEGWKKYFEEAQMPESIIRPLVTRALKIIDKLTQRKQDILDQIEEIERAIKACDTLAELQRLNSKIDTVLEMDVPDYIVILFGEYSDSIKRLGYKTQNLPQTIDELVQLEREVIGNTVFERVFCNEIKMLLEKYTDMEDDWIDNVLSPIEGGEVTTASQCTSYIEKLQAIPNYVSEETCIRARSAEKIIISTLHSCRIQGVISMYNALSDEEKQEFLNAIK